MGAKFGVMQGYRRTKEKEVRWDGCSEVGVAHSTDEVGEPTWRDPMEGRGGHVAELLEGTIQEASNSQRITP